MGSFYPAEYFVHQRPVPILNMDADFGLSAPWIDPHGRRIDHRISNLAGQLQLHGASN